ncbi:MAG: DNA replication/repair protein RecF [Candidatus Aureabacteria bacterium]|nr:DNA replication/repair protein RecF [Candidatus Auribacterota bacterium]
MRLKSLELRDFRNYKSVKIDFSDGINILWGKNAQGKTNILEAIYFLATARSFRTIDRKSLISWNGDRFLLGCKIGNGAEKRLRILFSNSERKASLNSKRVNKLSDLIGILRVVIFTPEDIFLLKGNPFKRRRFLDICISQIDREYVGVLQKFKQVLIRRNFAIRKYGNRSSSFLWDNQLAESVAFIMGRRKEVIARIAEKADEYHRDITSGKERLRIEYKPSVKTKEISEKEIFAHYEKNRKKDSEELCTTTGPHRDDIDFFINGKDVKLFGSEGQQRSAVLSLKNAEFALMKKETKETPLILADDVLPVLDRERKRAFLPSLKGNAQIFITCTDKRDIESIGAKANVFRVFNGNVARERV